MYLSIWTMAKNRVQLQEHFSIQMMFTLDDNGNKIHHNFGLSTSFNIFQMNLYYLNSQLNAHTTNQSTYTHAHDRLFGRHEWISNVATLDCGTPIHSLHVSAVKRTERMSLVTQFNVEVANVYFSNIENWTINYFISNSLIIHLNSIELSNFW